MSGGRGARGRSRPGAAPRPRRLRALLPAAAVALALLLGGCGIPLDSTPIALPTGQLPEALRPTPNTEPTKANGAPITKPCDNRCVTVYFTGSNDLLVPNVRYLSKPFTAMTLVQGLQQSLNALIEGPTVEESNVGDESTWLSFPKPLPVLTVLGVRAGVATIDLDQVTTETGDTQYEYALGQIVWTIAGTSYFPTVKAVSFEYEGAPYPAILPNGDLRNNPVTRQDFRAIAPAAS